MNAAIVRLCGDTTPGCYMNAVVELAASKLQLGDILKQCMSHFQPIEQRVHHLSDDGRAERLRRAAHVGWETVWSDGMCHPDLQDECLSLVSFLVRGLFAWSCRNDIYQASIDCALWTLNDLERLNKPPFRGGRLRFMLPHSRGTLSS
jgi:hypothetical protein